MQLALTRDALFPNFQEFRMVGSEAADCAFGGKQPNLKLVSSEVFYADGSFLSVDGATVAVLKNQAQKAPRRRARLCFHPDPGATQHDMLIVMHRSSYVAPHCHTGKSETLTIVEGTCDAIIFDDAGCIARTIAMSPASEGGNFFYRMPEAVFHTLFFKSEWTVFIESTIGPFDRSATRVASWAPPETDPAAGHRYLSGLLSGSV